MTYLYKTATFPHQPLKSVSKVSFLHRFHCTIWLQLDRKQYLPLIKFRISNHRLPIETGRWENVPFDDRKCQLCHKDELGDEFHYLFCCNYFETERKRHLKPNFYKRPNIVKLKELLASDNLATLKKLSEFVQIIMNKCATTFST